ncbi:carboxypeptidase regulatory-like domain-containing protein [Paenibacillus athensensis]|uniref:SdrD B-like domain-containing protein n=1 Tax=Paenibacillus athensensis TaxID=1967502 RepID=UPI001430188C|nr:SdrD B-like domain-containing protein [Paenibacillus athensensis]MCD1259295.1 carboxypeptidase regulatory-like domain-containing protein [Paenibacillus athensensis]
MRFSRRALALVLALSLINLPYFSILVSAAGAISLSLQKTVDKTTALPGETITYTIKYANPSTTDDAEHMVITDVLPAGLEYVGADTSVDVASVDTSTPGTVKFVMVHPLSAGKTGVLKLKTRFKPGTTLAGDTAQNTATAKADNSAVATATAPVVTAQVNAPDWSISKSKLLPAIDPTMDSPVTYRMTLQGNSAIGGTNIQNVRVVDTLPAGATFLSASGGGVYDSVYGSVAWDLPVLNAGQSVSYNVVLSYPGATFHAGDTVTNSVYAAGTDLSGASLMTNIATATHMLTGPTPGVYGIHKESRQASDEYAIGQTVAYKINGFGNQGNVDLDTFTVEDAIPDAIELAGVSTGSYTNNAGVNVTVQYQINGINTWHDWTGGVGLSTAADQSLNVSALGLAGSDYVSRVRWVFGAVPASFRIASDIQLQGTLLGVDHASAPVAVNDTITNTATLNASYGATPLSSSSSVTIKAVNPRPWIVAAKSVVGSASVREGDTVTYQLRIQNHPFATGDLTAPEIVDFFPEDKLDSYTVVGIDQSHATTPDAAPVATSYDKVIGADTFKAKLWTFANAVLKPGDYIDVTVRGTVKTGAPNGNFGNTMFATTTATNDYKGTTVDDTTDDRDNDGNTQKFVASTANVYVKFTGSLDSVKWVKGELDGVFTKYPANGETLPGGKAMYQLRVGNTNSNGPISNIVIIDKLPRIGDIGVVDTSARSSDWRPYLVNVVTGAGGAALDPQIKVYYSTTNTPDLGDISDPLNRTHHTGWSLTAPADITTVTALKFDFGNITLNPGESVTLEWDMRAPVHAPRNKIAWNSFGYGATYPDEGGPQAFLPSEPIKVGFLVQDPDPVGTGNLGDFIWKDTNADGIQDAGEDGINGVLVNLYKHGDYSTPYAYTRTFNDHVSGKPGYYAFPNLPADDYTVEFVMPAGYYLSPNDRGADDAKDSDFTLYDNASRTYRVNKTLAADETDMTLDAGIYTKGALGDLVWEDTNANGRQDGGEPGISGVTVELYDAADLSTLLQSTTTNASGKYSFTNLDPGHYQIKFLLPTGYKSTLKNQGNNTGDSDRDAVTGFSDTITLSSGETNNTIDAGFYLGEIGDLVWHDRNANGVQDAGEPGVSGVTVKLYDASDLTTALRTTTTDASGIYKFTSLLPGNYAVKFTRPGAYAYFSPSDQGANDAKDSDAVFAARTDGEAIVSGISLSDGGRDYSFDAGLFNPASLGDKVFLDVNKNGIQDIGEPGLAGITVKLYSASAPAVAIATTTTDAAGLYQFTNLDPGDYVVEWTVPAGYGVTAKDQGGSDALDSDADPATGRSDTVTLQSGDTNVSVDAGLYQLTNGTLGDLVWHDRNANGVQDAGEPGISGVTVELYDADTNALLNTATTDAGGHYLFTNLPLLANYKVKFLKPVGFKESPANAGGDDSADSDRDPVTGFSHTVSLLTVVNDLTVDAGFYQTAQLGDLVWEDTNANGRQGVGEPGISGVTVELYDASDLTTALQSTTTDISGNYSFTNLDPGSYKVKFIKPAGYKSTLLNQGDDAGDSDRDAATGFSDTIVLDSGETNNTVDAGFYLGEIGDLVWHDRNGNGVQDAGEPGIAGVTVTLYDASDLTTALRTTTTDASGLYAFTSLQPGQYALKFVRPGGYAYFSPVDQGADDAKDSDAAYTLRTDNEAWISSISLNEGERTYTYDAGLFNPASLGDTVFLDANSNGQQDPGESGLPNVTVKLYSAAAPAAAIATTVTDVWGQYGFANLEPGNYVVEWTVPAGYGVTAKDQGGSDALDSDADPLSGRSDTVTLQSGDNNLTVDAGLYELTNGTLGDFVWDDLNANGIQDAGEPGLPGVTVELYNANTNALLNTAVTDAGGQYLFTHLRLLNPYKVKFLKPAGFKESPAHAGADDSVDSDRDVVTGFSHTVSLLSVVNDLTVDAGFYQLARLGDLVFLDAKVNGIQDPGEKGVPNVPVSLYASGDLTTPLATTTTAADGSYLFDQLEPGSYVVEFAPAGRYVFTYKNFGPDRAVDSNANVNGRTDAITLQSGDDNRTIDAGIYIFTGGGSPPAIVPETPTPEPTPPAVTPTPAPTPPPGATPPGPGAPTATPAVTPTPVPSEPAPTPTPQAVKTGENTPVQGQIPLPPKTGEEEKPPVLTVIEEPANGTVQLADDGSWVYTPNEGFTGDDSFTVSVDDGDGGRSFQNVAVEVTPKNAQLGSKAASKPLASLVPKTGQADYSKLFLAGLILILAGLAVFGATYWRARRSK